MHCYFMEMFAQVEISFRTKWFLNVPCQWGNSDEKKAPGVIKTWDVCCCLCAQVKQAFWTDLGNVETNLSTDCSDFLIPLQWNRIFAMAVKHCFCRTEDTWKFSLWASALGPDNQPTDQTHTALVKWASELSGRTDWLASACLWVVSERPERTLCSAACSRSSASFAPACSWPYKNPAVLPGPRLLLLHEMLPIPKAQTKTCWIV